jgi:hypothetical protein
MRAAIAAWQAFISECASVPPPPAPWVDRPSASVVPSSATITAAKGRSPRARALAASAKACRR